MTNVPDHLCHACVKDKFLKAEIKASGIKAVCMSCGKKRAAMEFIPLTRRIDEAVQEHYAPNSDGDGQNWAEIVAEQAAIGPEIAEEMRQWLSSTRGYSARKDGGEDDYDRSTVYDERRHDRGTYLRRWEQFKDSVKQEARFFNRHAEAYLDDIFTGIEQLASWNGIPVISTWEPSPVTPLVRARVAQSDAELTTYLSNPAKELGPPPPGTASAGRMNAAGVSVFYGAMDIPTCRAEVRPPVGSHVVFALFEFLRPLRILHMDALARIAVPGSIFDPDYPVRLARAAFLRNFGDEIAQPVMPRDEAFGYLPTQIVADYIGQRLQLDGMLYRSVQSGTERTSSGGYPQNIVLFNHASRVEAVDVSCVKLEVDLGWFDEDEHDGDDSITVREDELPKKRKPAKPKANPDPFSFEEEPALPDNDDRSITLRFVPDSVTVQHIKGVRYDPSVRQVSYFRQTLKEQRERQRHWSKVMGPRRNAKDLIDLF